MERKLSRFKITIIMRPIYPFLTTMVVFWGCTTILFNIAAHQSHHRKGVGCRSTPVDLMPLLHFLAPPNMMMSTVVYCGITLESTTVKASQRLRFQFCVVFPFFILIKCDFGILAFDITVEAVERGKMLAF